MRKVKLKDILKVRRGTTLSGEYYAESGKYIRLTLGNFNYPNGGFKKNTSKNDIYFIGPIKEDFILKKWDIITPLTEQVAGLLGETARIPEDNLYIQSGDIGLVLPNEELLDRKFCYYLISSRNIKKQLGACAQQTKIRHTSPDKIEDCIAYIPEKEQQHKIGKLLFSIDEKIKLNNKINSELEGMTKELYEYWFVQFDFPGENGRPYKSSGGKMVWNEELNREIPEGWEVKMIKDTFGSVGGYSFSSDDYVENGKYKLYTIGNVQDGYIVSEVDNYLDYLPDNMPEECLLKPGEMLMSLTGNVGRVGFVYENNALLNQRVLKLQSEEGHKAFMYMTFIQDSMKLTLERISNGTSQKNLSPINMGKLKMVVPPEEVLKKYDSMCNPMIDKMVNNFAENQKLSELRDFLLPMLMNGQVTVK